MADGTGVLGAEAVGHGVDVGQQQQGVGVHGAGQQGGGQVLVHDRLDAAQRARGVRHHRDAAAARADHQRAGLEQHPDERQLHQLERLGGRNDPAPRGAITAYRPAALGRQVPRLRFLVDRADELDGIGEGGIVRVDPGLAHQASGRLAGHRAAQRPDQPVPDHPLGLRAERVQPVRAAQRGVTRALQGQQADLRPVAVGHDEVVGPAERRERVHRLMFCGVSLDSSRPGRCTMACRS
jgi:hypothetical protein